VQCLDLLVEDDIDDLQEDALRNPQRPVDPSCDDMRIHVQHRGQGVRAAEQLGCPVQGELVQARRHGSSSRRATTIRPPALAVNQSNGAYLVARSRPP
jgi:hypothetical protein